LGAVAAGQQLRVKSATAKSVQLEWTGAGGPATVERAAGTTFEKLTTNDQGSYEDKSISRFGSYRYRISSAGKTSNEVTVGPPPPGVSNAAPLTKGTEPAKYGATSAIAFDENGDPVIAFEWADPNGDADFSDGEIRFVRWSRAAYKWLPAQKVAVVREVQSQNLNPVSIACDSGTGTLVIVTPVGDKDALVLVSNDGGATWKNAAIPGFAGTLYSSAMAVVSGTVHLVINAAEGGVHYLTGPITDVSAWKNDPLPSDAGWKHAGNANVSLKMDRSGKPVIAWYEEQQEGDARRFRVWQPGGKPNTILETRRPSDFPNLSLAIGGGKIGFLFSAVLDEKDDDHSVWYTQSADTVAWSKPSKLPIDGPRSTNPPLSLALDSQGGIVAVFAANSGSGSTGCNYPVLSRSTDGASWKTCGPGKAEGGDFSPQPANLHALEAENDKVYVLWQEVGDNKFHEGMLLWHER
jgi:hypothetical protein